MIFIIFNIMIVINYIYKSDITIIDIWDIIKIKCKILWIPGI